MWIGDIGDELHGVGAVVVGGDTYEVYPGLHIERVHLYVVVGGLCEVGYFLACHSLHGGRQGALVTGLDLHKVIVAIGGDGHYIYFVGGATPVALGYDETVLAQPLHSGLLALGTYM